MFVRNIVAKRRMIQKISEYPKRGIKKEYIITYLPRRPLSFLVNNKTIPIIKLTSGKKKARIIPIFFMV